ncbi:DNA polymerase [Bacillus spizizenii]|uniref:DNA polymerase I n=1 Tax=Bacillus spizizenii TaxID=96241 RepID=A0A9Q4DN10_BACSC|nr:DNA polymerase [Bacillus spizizenii]MCY8155205.1 DNA polymerase [Bacillus spizizenii]MCY8313025.1 DNA polymerase [Bacillus spizizenii]MCY8416560.1 DNA polymerase [Bacillus spizizenii]MCY9333635.1 DNA polymerase [Bacillus spizizenii]
MSDQNTVEDDILGALDKREKKESTKKTRTKKSEPKKKAKKVTKKEQQIIDIANSIKVPDNYHLINTPELFEKFVQHYTMYKTMYQEPYVFVDTETYGVNPFKDEIISISIGFMDDNHFDLPIKPFKHPSSVDVPSLDHDLVVNTLRPLLQQDKKLVLANAKFDIHVLYNWCGIDITFNICWDTMVAAGLLNENMPKGLKEWYKTYALPDLVARGLMEDERKLPTFKFGSMFDKIPFDEVPHNLATYYACHDTFMTKAVFQYQKSILEDPTFGLDGVMKLFKEVEMPLIPVLATAERKGIKVDGDFLEKDIGYALSKKLAEIKQGIYDHLGSTIVLQKTKTRQKNGIKFKEHYEVTEEFNLGSPAQLSRKLYVDNKILEPVMEYDKESKKQVPKNKTDKKTLTRNKNAHPVIPLILEYRGLSKLIDAFCNKLPKEPQGTIDGRIHCSYNQLVRTGRMSCSNPNLQQIPSKFDLIRYGFRADEGRTLVSIDFSQQELRWLAIFTQEPSLIEVYSKGLDMHSRVTCQVHGFDYNMFEQIRNYKGDTAEETERNLKEAMDNWKYTEEIQFAIAKYNATYGTNFDSDVLDDNITTTLASFFELLRKKTKSVVFGTVYGITEIGLADQIQGTKEEAKALIDGFKAGLPYYLRWEAETHKKVLASGYVETWLGRKRRFGETLQEAYASDLWRKRKWHWLVEKCKRQSTNVLIQGTSADQVKKAMVELFYPKRPDGTVCFDRTEWLENGYQSKLEEHDVNLLLQVHDELVFEAPETVEWSALQELAEIMQNVIPTEHLGVQFKSDIEASPYWGGNFSPEELSQIANGELDWRETFAKEVKKKMEKELGHEYELGLFTEKDEVEDEDQAA